MNPDAFVFPMISDVYRETALCCGITKRELVAIMMLGHADKGLGMKEQSKWAWEMADVFWKRQSDG